MYYDYSEKRSLPISIPDYHYNERGGERYVAFNIYMAGRHLCSRRYREFSKLHCDLKKEFIGEKFFYFVHVFTLMNLKVLLFRNYLENGPLT